MRQQELKDYIKQRKHLFWYTPKDKVEDVSDELLVEMILNYGTLKDVKELFRIMGRENVAKVFFDTINQSERKANNYFEIIRNYFTLLFNRYVQ